MASFDELKQLLDEVLQLGARVDDFDHSTQLLGSLPEFDSMAVVSLIGSLEDNFGFAVSDDEISAETFATCGSLHDFVVQKLAG